MEERRFNNYVMEDSSSFSGTSKRVRKYFRMYKIKAFYRLDNYKYVSDVGVYMPDYEELIVTNYTFQKYELLIRRFVTNRQCKLTIRRHA